MKTFVTISLISAVLIACGSESGDDPGPKQPDPPAPPTEGAPKDRKLVDTDVEIDAGQTPSTPSEPSTPTDDAGSPPACTPQSTLGHCVTHMATLCYETSYDATSECASSGMSSGWSEGPCDTSRSSGGCYLDCQVSYSYPLGGSQPTDVSRAAVKESCESAGGTYIDTTPIPEDGGTDTDTDAGSY